MTESVEPATWGLINIAVSLPQVRALAIAGADCRADRWVHDAYVVAAVVCFVGSAFVSRIRSVEQGAGGY